MSATFVPGPWEFRLEAVRTVIFHKGEMGEKAIAVGAGGYPDHIANARLIAAAPTMFDVLEAAFPYVEDADTRGRISAVIRQIRGDA